MKKIYKPPVGVTKDIRWAKTKALIGAANFMSPARDLVGDDVGIYATNRWPFVPNSCFTLSRGYNTDDFMVCDIKQSLLLFTLFSLNRSHLSF